MNLVLDFGNTRIKTAFFKGEKLVKQQAFSNVNELLNSDWLKEPIEFCLISSVTESHRQIISI